MPIQLDIFEHSRDVMLNNAIVEAWLKHDLPTVRQGIARLCEECPRDRNAPRHERLLEQLQQFVLDLHPRSLAVRRSQLETQILPLAAQLLGKQQVSPWGRPLFRALAEVASPLRYDPRHPEIHAAALWLAADDFAEARQAVNSIESWRRIPQPLAWMTRIEWITGMPEKAWPLLAELAWLAPALLELQLQSVAATVNALISHFSSDFENNSEFPDLSWLPAWLLIHYPAYRELLRPAEPNASDPARAFGLLLALLHLERNGQQAGLIAQRARLRALAPDIFASYMRSR